MLKLTQWTETKLFPKADSSARQHAIKSYPEECCGLIVDGEYIPQVNIAANKKNEFEMDPSVWITYEGRINGIVHSHCSNHAFTWPSVNDMTYQISNNIPWGIVQTDGNKANSILWFGDHVLDEPLLHRTFLHGVRDCYGLVRAVLWQHKNIKVPDFPRAWKWWKDTEQVNLFEAHIREYADPVKPRDIKPFDSILVSSGIKGIPTHIGILLEDGLILHHEFGKLSRRDTLGAMLERSVGWYRCKSL